LHLLGIAAIAVIASTACGGVHSRNEGPGSAGSAAHDSGDGRPIGTGRWADVGRVRSDEAPTALAVDRRGRVYLATFAYNIVRAHSAPTSSVFQLGNSAWSLRSPVASSGPSIAVTSDENLVAGMRYAVVRVDAAGEQTMLGGDLFEVVDVATDRRDTPFVLLGDSSVLRWEGDHWQPLGPSSSEGNRTSTLAVSGEGEAYVAYASHGPLGPGGHQYISVQKFSGSSWEYVGRPQIAAASAFTGPNLRISQDGTLFLAFYDPNDGHVAVATYARGDWVRLGDGLGTDRCSGAGSESGIHQLRPPIAVTSSGIPYVVYMPSSSPELRAARWIGKEWQELASVDAKPHGDQSCHAPAPVLASTPDDIYVAYAAAADDAGPFMRDIVVKRFVTVASSP
jgi:hypothetical protein